MLNDVVGPAMARLVCLTDCNGGLTANTWQGDAVRHEGAMRGWKTTRERN